MFFTLGLWTMQAGIKAGHSPEIWPEVGYLLTIRTNILPPNRPSLLRCLLSSDFVMARSSASPYAAPGLLLNKQPLGA
jgi:hypothetical protein